MSVAGGMKGYPEVALFDSSVCKGPMILPLSVTPA